MNVVRTRFPTKFSPFCQSRMKHRNCSDNVFVGKPDSNSNIRPIKIERHKEDSALQTRLNDLQEKTQLWHHQFWSEHNKKYFQMRDDYKEKHLGASSDESTLIDQEKMALFYRQFLQDNRDLQQDYDRKWRKLNREIIALMAIVAIQRFVMSPTSIFARKKRL